MTFRSLGALTATEALGGGGGYRPPYTGPCLPAPLPAATNPIPPWPAVCIAWHSVEPLVITDPGFLNIRMTRKNANIDHSSIILVHQ